jgi:hypothetical protein
LSILHVKITGYLKKPLAKLNHCQISLLFGSIHLDKTNIVQKKQKSLPKPQNMPKNPQLDKTSPAAFLGAFWDKPMFCKGEFNMIL